MYLIRSNADAMDSNCRAELVNKLTQVVLSNNAKEVNIPVLQLISIRQNSSFLPADLIPPADCDDILIQL